MLFIKEKSVTCGQEETYLKSSQAERSIKVISFKGYKPIKCFPMLACLGQMSLNIGKVNSTKELRNWVSLDIVWRQKVSNCSKENREKELKESRSQTLKIPIPKMGQLALKSIEFNKYLWVPGWYKKIE